MGTVCGGGQQSEEEECIGLDFPRQRGLPTCLPVATVTFN